MTNAPDNEAPRRQPPGAGSAIGMAAGIVMFVAGLWLWLPNYASKGGLADIGFFLVPGGVLTAIISAIVRQRAAWRRR